MSDQNANLRVADFDFDLPEELIAQQPPAERGTSRMLVLNRGNGSLEDRSFADFPSLLNPGDLLVLNDSRVIPARLFARRVNSRGYQEPSAQIEVLLTAPDAAGNWNTLVRPGRKVRRGDHLEFPTAAGQIALNAEVLTHGEFGHRVLRFEPVPDFYATLDQIGHMPLPPYIKRPNNEDTPADKERYQTVFAEQRGSVAAPTAGLHFTPSILDAITARGVEIAKITLHVGLGTFAPLRVENLSEIQLHTEHYAVSAATADALNRARGEDRRIVAVGTTTVRTLEHIAQLHQSIEAHSGSTNIFISPGHEFRIVNAMLTNFHLPKSSLLMLVSAFAGRDEILIAYKHAVAHQYRFFSYGDCMFLA